jgi:hypothetical protein
MRLGLRPGAGPSEPLSALAAADSASLSSSTDDPTGSLTWAAVVLPAAADVGGLVCVAANTPNAATAGSARAGTAIPSLLAALCAVSGAQWRPVFLIFLGLRCPEADATTCLTPFLAQLLSSRWVSLSPGLTCFSGQPGRSDHGISRKKFQIA